MGNQIIGKAFQINEIPYYTCPRDVSLDCENSSNLGVEWFIPTQSGGVQNGYQKRRSKDKPTADSVKTLRIRDKNDGSTYWVLINDDDTISEWSDRCSACCGDLTPLDAVTVPTPLLEEYGCLVTPPSEDAVYTYRAIAPDAAAGKVFRLSGSKNGVPFTPAFPADGYAALADAVAWADSNWSAFGDFTLEADGNTVLFESDDAETGNIIVYFGSDPVANAGPDQTGVTASSVTLTSASSTAGTGETITDRLWTQVSGPNTATLATPTAATTTASGLAVGTYVFRVTITNSAGNTSADTVSIVKSA